MCDQAAEIILQNLKMCSSGISPRFVRHDLARWTTKLTSAFRRAFWSALRRMWVRPNTPWAPRGFERDYAALLLCGFVEPGPKSAGLHKDLGHAIGLR